MRRVVLTSVLLLLCSAVLGATVFREQVAQAAQAILPVKVVNTTAEAVPVSQQGVVDVNVRNGSLTISEGETTPLGAFRAEAGNGSFEFDVSSARAVRLLVRQHSCTSPPTAHVVVRLNASTSSPDTTASVIVDSFDAPCSFDGVTRVYELPGQQMQISWANVTGVVDFIALGRAN